MSNPYLIDIAGKKFYRWTVLYKDKIFPDKPTRWICKCDCGTIKSVTGISLRKAAAGEMKYASRSCGCLKIEETIKRETTHGHSHIGKISPTYRSWYNMLTRCRNKNSTRYKDYGGRGIKVCDGWYNFINFLNDMGERPSKKYSIDRIDNEKGYEKNNCRWATAIQQARNKRIKLL